MTYLGHRRMGVRNIPIFQIAQEPFGASCRARSPDTGARKSGISAAPSIQARI